MTKSLALTTVLIAAILNACGTLPKSGGYYEDDGPHAQPWVDVSEIPDAEPRAEPRSRYGNNTYTVNGNTYRPLQDPAGYRARGIASWYGKKFHGKRTANGERYSMYAMTAAHRILPLPSYVRVRNLENGRSVVVRVNDRGPFLHNRLIDLSYAAAARLGMIGTGTGLVEVQALTAGRPGIDGPGSGAPEKPRLYLQVGAFTLRDNADSLRARLVEAEFRPISIQSDTQDGVRLYRVHIGPLQSVEESDRLVERMADYGISDAHVIVQ